MASGPQLIDRDLLHRDLRGQEATDVVSRDGNRRRGTTLSGAPAADGLTGLAIPLARNIPGFENTRMKQKVDIPKTVDKIRST